MKFFKKFDLKKKKENKGLVAQKQLVKLLQAKDYNNDKFFESFIQSLIYMPSVKFEKIHKYLLGCCLEQIDADFNKIRGTINVNMPHLALQSWYTFAFPDLLWDLSKKWVDVPRENIDDRYKNKILLNFTERYRNQFIDYYFLLLRIWLSFFNNSFAFFIPAEV